MSKPLVGQNFYRTWNLTRLLTSSLYEKSSEFEVTLSEYT